ncbi:MAG: dephospho-CoA kinase [Desulfobacterales bacterium]|nr:dephospho-CoA kinase [Desulfobacterales bacterium]
MPKVIGLTGGIASGKSLVSQTLAELGMTVIDADDVSHELMAKDKAVKQKVVETFGAGVLTEGGDVDRGKLGGIVFRDPGTRKDLERIMHPRILAQLRKRAHESSADVVLEIPLLIEQGGHERVDLVVVVYTTRERQVQRLMGRDGITREEAIRRIDAQLPLAEKVSYAHYVIDNSGTVEETEDQVTRFYKQIRGKERS